MAEENPFSNIPNAPSVEVRTLHGDVQSMSASGGTTMQVEDVTEMIGRKVAPQNQNALPQKGSSIIFKIIVLVLVILIAALITGFIVSAGVLPQVPSWESIFGSSSSSTLPTATSTVPAYVPSTSAVNFDPYSDIEPQRFLRIPADTTFSLILSREAAETTEDLLTFSQRLTERLKTVPSSARFVEVELIKDGGKPIDGLTFMSLSGVSLFSEQFLKENFIPNILAFIYRDPRGDWPGYVFKLLPNKNPRLLGAQIQILERTPESTAVMFLSPPGSPKGTFVDGVRAGFPTREQSYTAPGAGIGYGWEDRYFVISTSLDGLEEALRRLQG